MKKVFFLAGVASGVAVANYWKTLTKEGIKAGIRTGRRLQEISHQALEDLEDVTAEAAVELAEEDQNGSGDPQKGSGET